MNKDNKSHLRAIGWALLLNGMLLTIGGCLWGRVDPATKPPEFNTTATTQVTTANQNTKECVKVIRAGTINIRELAKSIPKPEGILASVASIEQSADQILKNTAVIDAANKAIVDNQAEIKKWIQEESRRDSEMLAAKDVTIAELQKQLKEKDKVITKQDKTITAMNDAGNQKLLWFCRLSGFLLCVGGIVILFQFATFAKLATAMIIAGVGAEVFGVVYKQLCLWSKPVTIVACLVIIALENWALWQIAHKNKKAVEEVVEGVQRLKDKMPEVDAASFSEKMQLVTDKTTKRIIEHSKAGLRIGKYKDSGDTRSWWKRLFGIGDPTSK